MLQDARLVARSALPILLTSSVSPRRAFAAPCLLVSPLCPSSSQLGCVLDDVNRRLGDLRSEDVQRTGRRADAHVECHRLARAVGDRDRDSACSGVISTSIGTSTLGGMIVVIIKLENKSRLRGGGFARRSCLVSQSTVFLMHVFSVTSRRTRIPTRSQQFIRAGDTHDTARPRRGNEPPLILGAVGRGDTSN